MTRKEAYQRLDIAEDADIQEVRRKFAAMHSDYRMRIDNAPTPRLRQLFEQQLEQIKEAYSFLNGSEGIDDTIDLPRTKRMMDEDAVSRKDQDTTKSHHTSEHSLLEAYDYFGLSPEDDKATLNNLINTKFSELKTGLQSQSLPTAQKLYEAELEKAESLKKLLVADRQEKEALARKIAEKREQERIAGEKEQSESTQKNTFKAHPTASKRAKLSKKPKTTTLVIIGLLAVIMAAFIIHLLTRVDQETYTAYLEKTIKAAKNRDAKTFGTSLRQFSEALKQDDISPASLSRKNMDLYMEALYQGINRMDDENISDTTAKKAQEYIRYEIENNPKKMFMLGWFYHQGKGVEKNYDQARQWWEKAAEKGDVLAMNDMGDLYYFGHGVARNYAKAKYWYEKAMLKGNAEAMYNLGYLYAKGKGVTQDYAKAKYWYEKGAKKGNAGAMNNLGALYANGEGVTQDYETAKYWYKKAAEQGYSWSMKNLGNMYKDTREYVQALYWYLKAAEKGNVESMNKLGDLYYYGSGIEQDYFRAKYWWEKAADKGYKKAMQNLGWLYRNGFGVKQDDEKADFWYKKAKATE